MITVIQGYKVWHTTFALWISRKTLCEGGYTELNLKFGQGAGQMKECQTGILSRQNSIKSKIKKKLLFQYSLNIQYLPNSVLNAGFVNPASINKEVTY